MRLNATPPPAPDATTEIIADKQAALRYTKAQRYPWKHAFQDPVRPAKEIGKVAKALKELSWDKDPATLDLMRTYRIDAILNDTTHISVTDPVGDRYTGLTNWTQLLADEFGLHPDFISFTCSADCYQSEVEPLHCLADG